MSKIYQNLTILLYYMIISSKESSQTSLLLKHNNSPKTHNKVIECITPTKNVLQKQFTHRPFLQYI